MGLLALLPVAAVLAPAVLAQGSGSTNSTSGAINATATVTGKYGVQGTFTFSTAEDSEVVHVAYHVTGLDAAAQKAGNSSFQFLYHVHTNPVPPDGNCTGTLGHLDPFNVTEAVVCDPTAPQYCQEGDLSGKHGKLPNQASVEGSYDDPYLRFWPEPLSLFGRSITVHYPNKTRIACGNITSFVDGTADQNGVPTNASSTYVTVYPNAPPTGPTGPFTLSFSESGGSTIAVADSTTLAALPDVQSVPNAVLSTQSNTPTLVAAASSFVYSGQPISAFPTQSQSPYPSAGSAASGSGSGTSAAPSASQSSGATRNGLFGVVGALIGGVALVAAII